jgi:hypothetical protein
MSKIAIVLAVACLASTPSLSLAQDAPTGGAAPQTLTEAASKALIDRRVEIIRVTLGLTPEQQKLWPAVEDAMRARLTERHMRFANVAARIDQAPGDFNPIEVMRKRADALSQRGASLKTLADAWQPLYATLDTDQKRRLRFLAGYVLREMQDAAEARFMQSEDEDGDQDD